MAFQLFIMSLIHSSEPVLNVILLALQGPDPGLLFRAATKEIDLWDGTAGIRQEAEGI